MKRHGLSLVPVAIVCTHLLSFSCDASEENGGITLREYVDVPS